MPSLHAVTKAGVSFDTTRVNHCKRVNCRKQTFSRVCALCSSEIAASAARSRWL